MTHFAKKSFIPAMILAIGFFALGILSGVTLPDSPKAQCEQAFRFVNVNIVCGKAPVIKKTGYVETENAIAAFIASEKAAGRVTDVAVYFRDLVNGPIFGLNESADFAPASLLKLPLALVYLTQAERDPNVLGQQLSVAKPEWRFSEYYSSSQTIDPTEPHMVSDLLMHMLTYSDNNAYGVLRAHLDETGQGGLVTQAFLELGFLDPKNVADETLSTRQYAGILRGLYNASFLSAELSEKVLSWLVQSDFTQGLRADIPKDVPIAHKFGERTNVDGVSQLHDCGIVYYPGNPYLLCIMTRGKDFADLAAAIRRISSIVYTEVSSRRI